MSDRIEQRTETEHLAECACPPPFADCARWGCPAVYGAHEWLDRPESDTRECLICGTEVAG